MHRSYGMAWGVGGWLLMNFLQKVGPREATRLKERVTAEIKTTFASHYTDVVSLTEALNLDELAAYAKWATGQKVLIDPSRST